MDGQEVALLDEAFHVGEVADHIGNDKSLQLKDGGVCVGRRGDIDEGFALQSLVGEVEVPKVDFIVVHVNAFAWGLRLHRDEGQQEHGQYKGQSFHCIIGLV